MVLAIYFVNTMLFVLTIYVFMNHTRISEEVRHPLKRRNAMTEKEIEEILRRMKNNLKND